MKVICQICNKEIDPIAIDTFDGKITTKYHWGCKMRKEKKA